MPGPLPGMPSSGPPIMGPSYWAWIGPAATAAATLPPSTATAAASPILLKRRIS